VETKTLYQTLADRGNIKEIETDGPFPCNWPNTWLGEGYYLWDTFISNAHWWGQVWHKNGYIIAEGICDFEIEKCFDLLGNMEHVRILGEVAELLKNKKFYCENTITVALVIEFIKKTTNFNYEAIRASGIDSINKNSKRNDQYIDRLPFESRLPAYLDLKPTVQMCLLHKGALNFRNFKIVFPELYNNSYTL
jgi:hypothetical protein